MRTREQVIEQVQKILQRTQGNGCSEEEAATAYAMASRLMAEHNLDMAAVEAHQPVGAVEFEAVAGTTEYERTLETDLASRVCDEFFFVRTYYQGAYDAKLGRRMTKLMFFGSPGNVETAVWVYKSLRTAFGKLWVQFWKDHPHRGVLKPREMVEARRSFVAGAAAGFSARLRAERRDLERDRTGSSTALACIAEKLDAALVAAVPDLRPGHRLSQPVLDRSWEVGYQRGQDLTLARPVEGRGSGAGKAALPA